MSVDQLIGDAQQIWRREKSSTNKCVCTKECDESCLNRVTWVECTDGICPIGRHCGNRAFADLMDRVKLDTKFAIGVEVELVGACKRKHQYA
jgi:histone-lysine N-methyltransferase ASH1L